MKETSEKENRKTVVNNAGKPVVVEDSFWRCRLFVTKQLSRIQC